MNAREAATSDGVIMGHFLVGYLLGVLPKGYRLPSMEVLMQDKFAEGRVDFIGFKFLKERGYLIFRQGLTHMNVGLIHVTRVLWKYQIPLWKYQFPTFRLVLKKYQRTRSPKRNYVMDEKIIKCNTWRLSSGAYGVWML